MSSHAASVVTAPELQGAVGVTADGVESMDIAVPVFQFSATHAFSDEPVTTAYKVARFSLTGKTNTGGFRGFSAGEVLFLGASGSRRTPSSSNCQKPLLSAPCPEPAVATPGRSPRQKS